jgi:hypothetical protein
MRDLIIIKKKEAVYYKLLSVLYFLIDCLQKTKIEKKFGWQTKPSIYISSRYYFHNFHTLFTTFTL